MRQLVFGVIISISVSVLATDLLIFGGKEHRTFLGILNADKYTADSIWNKFGLHGSKYVNNCIWNKYGDYGGQYSDTSPFNVHGTTPPVIVDKDGHFYGYLTIDKHNPRRAGFRLANIVCELWKTASGDLDAVYEIAKEHFIVNESPSRGAKRNPSASREASSTMYDLEGALLIADDGTFLGKITYNDVIADSIFNSVGKYGSDVSSTSIWNDVSYYGSDVSPQSPFNDVASVPPKIVKGGKLIGYLTTNTAKPRAIHPCQLLNLLDSSSDKMYRKKLLEL